MVEIRQETACPFHTKLLYDIGNHRGNNLNVVRLIVQGLMGSICKCR